MSEDPIPSNPEADQAKASSTKAKKQSDLQAPSTGAGDVQMSTEEMNNLSPEEQLARFEEAMKNDDWGHQPC